MIGKSERLSSTHEKVTCVNIGNAAKVCRIADEVLVVKNPILIEGNLKLIEIINARNEFALRGEKAFR
jgi:hypothetical protein